MVKEIPDPDIALGLIRSTPPFLRRALTGREVWSKVIKKHSVLNMDACGRKPPMSLVAIHKHFAMSPETGLPENARGVKQKHKLQNWSNRNNSLKCNLKYGKVRLLADLINDDKRLSLPPATAMSASAARVNVAVELS